MNALGFTCELVNLSKWHNCTGQNTHTHTHKNKGGNLIRLVKWIGDVSLRFCSLLPLGEADKGFKVPSLPYSCVQSHTHLRTKGYDAWQNQHPR